MPIISKRHDFNGVAQKIERLKLQDLVDEVEHAITGFEIEIEETKHANGTKGLRQLIDDHFTAIGGWTKLVSGGIDWKKQNDQGASIGVEVQVSGRSDMLAVDIMHLRGEIQTGFIDVGIIIVPDDELSKYLTDRTPNLRTALKHVEDQANQLPIRVLAFKHEKVGAPMGKMRTNLGKA